MDHHSEQAQRLFADTQWLQRVARQMVNNPTAADDLVQDTWLAALRYRGKAILNRRAWLRSLLSNLLVSQRRGETARLAREAEVARTEALPSSADLCERAEMQRVMGEALLALEEPNRTTALLRFLEGMEPLEIAQRQGVPVNTVRWRLRRSVDFLRERLDSEVGQHWGLALLSLMDPKKSALGSGPLHSATTFGLTLIMKKTLLVGCALVPLAMLANRLLPEPAALDGLVGMPAADGDFQVTPTPAQLEAEPAGNEREVVSALPSSTDAAAIVSDTLAASATLLFQAVSLEHGRPLAGVAVMLEVGERSIIDYASSRKRLSDEAGELRLEVPAGETVHVQAWGEEPAAGLAVMDIEACAPGEVRTVRLKLPTIVDLAFCGRVVDEQTGLPVPDVDVLAKSPSGIPAAIETARTGVDGIFELQVPSWRSVTFRASRPGHGRIFFTPQAGHSQRAQALDLRLPGAATVRGLVDAKYGQTGSLRVQMETPLAQLLRPSSKSPWQFTTELWTAEVDSAGHYQLDGLNAGAEFSARLLVDGVVARELPGTLVLENNEIRSIDWVLDDGASVSGQIRDQFGEPLPDVKIWLRSAQRKADRRLFSFDRPDVSTSTSDSTGHFKFEDVPSGDWLIGPGAVEQGPGARVAPWAVHIRVEPGMKRTQLLLQGVRDLSIKGRVLDFDGRPVANCSVTVDCERSGTRRVRSNSEGHFVAIGLLDESYTFSAGGIGAGHARSNSITTKPGGQEALLVLGPSGSIRGRVLGIQGTNVRGAALISSRDFVDSDEGWTRVSVRLDGYFALDGLTPGQYDVFVKLKDGRCGLLSDHKVVASELEDEVQIKLGEVAQLELSTDEGVEWASYELFIGRALVAVGSCDEQGGEAHLVPPGQLEVRYQTSDGQEGSKLINALSELPTKIVLP
ncbi:MAG: RNA polymerase sigma-70 factor (ECF subfamily) [Candidatus Paceibacteria bacterium]|jgi:RNA polymerase sigma-70 factor (ECF subfamily)